MSLIMQKLTETGSKVFEYKPMLNIFLQNLPSNVLSLEH